MGYRAPDVMIQLINGEKVEDPLYTGLDTCNLDDPGFCTDH
jgi:ribose transport system substrate-binding protein